MTPDELETAIRAAMTAGDWAEAERLRADLDAVPRRSPGLASSALWYAEQGLQVFPLQPGSKVPYSGSRGCKDATTDPGQVRRWWAERPSANVGLATGHLVDVIDIDGPEGVRSWAAAGDLPPVLGTVSTPRQGGTHLYVRATGAGNRAAMRPGIDYRGLGGYVVAPPSVVGEVAYRWRRPLQVSRLLQPGDRGRCAACGTEMVLVEDGQTTHPGCEAAA